MQSDHLMELVNELGRTRIVLNTAKPYVGRTQYTKTWYWKCARCVRQEIMSGKSHAQVLAAAQEHARSWDHYYARYSAQPLGGTP